MGKTEPWWFLLRSSSKFFRGKAIDKNFLDPNAEPPECTDRSWKTPASSRQQPLRAMQLSLILYLCFFLVFVFHWVTTVVTDLLTFLMFFALPFLPCYFGESEVLLHSDLCMPQSLSTTQSNGAGFMASEAQSQSLLRCTAAHPTAEAKVKGERQLFKKRKRTHQLESVC